MTIRTLGGTRALVVLCVLIVAIVSGCSGKPPTATAPSPTQPVSKVTALRISGAATVFVGATAASEQLTATATLEDGRSSDVTARVVWSSSRPDILRIGSAGLVSGVAPGDVLVTATVDGVSSEHALTVVRRFRLSGVIRAADTGGTLRALLAGFADGVEEADWVGQSDGSGAYVVNVITRPVQVVVSAEGFEVEHRNLALTEDMVMDFALRPSRTPTDFSGAWRAFLSAPLSCRDVLPESGRDREYDVTIVQESAQVRITMSSPAMVRYPGEFGPATASVQSTGFVSGATLSTGAMNFGEVLTATSQLGVVGAGVMNLVDGELVGYWAGALQHWPVPIVGTSPLSRCGDFFNRGSLVLRRK